MHYFLGIDIGTTHTKAVVLGSDGKLFFEVKKGYDLLHPQPGYEEQDAELIMEAVASVLRQAIDSIPSNDKIVSIGFSAAMHSILAVDQSGKPLCHAMIWADTRSKKEAEEILQHAAADAIYAETGIPAHPMSPLCKILWLRNQQPHIFSNAAKFISIKEYVFFCLFGKYIVDHSLAAATGLFDIHSRKWNHKAMTLAGIDEKKLSEPVSTLHVENELAPFYAKLLGLKENIPFVVGASDGCLANFGSGVINHGETALTIGTSGAARMTVRLPGAIPKNIHSEDRLFTYPLADDIYVRGGAINNGGIVLKWLADLFLEKDQDNYEHLLEEAASVSPGANGLLFLPYLLGERAPVWDADARGALIGLSMTHKREHVIRAAIEGICFTLCQIIRKLEKVYGQVDEIYASGGFVHSRFWVQLLADITGKKINVTEMADASAIGAAYLGMYSQGVIRELSEVKQFTRICHTYTPDPASHETYIKIFEVFSSLYPKLKNDFAVLNSI